MRRMAFLPITIFIAVLALIFSGCGGVSGITVTDITSPNESVRDPSGSIAMGLWQVGISMETGEVTIVPQRMANWALNVVDILESQPNPGIEINPHTVIVNPAEHSASVEVRLRHAIPDLGGLFTMFDVRGIVFGPKVMNADGFTPQMNPAEFSGAPMGYLNGRLGTPDFLANYDAEYSGYKYFCQDLGPDDDLAQFLRSPAGIANRGSFPEGTQHRRRYELDWDEGTDGFLVFSYAVAASYAWPFTGSASPFEVADFSVLTANMAEAFCFDATITDNTVAYWSGIGSGVFTLELEVWDWQGFDDTDVILTVPEGICYTPMTETQSVPGTMPYSAIFRFSPVNLIPTSGDDIPLTLTVTDRSETYGSSWFGGLLPMTNWRYDDYVYAVWETTLTVNEEPPCLPYLMDETFDTTPAGWTTGPGSFWNFNNYTNSAADNRSNALCYGESSGVTTSWCESPMMYATPDCYELPLILVIEHQMDIEPFYDRCWVEIKVNCKPWTRINPYCGWMYNYNGWWDGYKELSESRFLLIDVEEGDAFWIRFVTQTMDGNKNCVQDGYNGWQIFRASIDDE